MKHLRQTLLFYIIRVLIECLSSYSRPIVIYRTINQAETGQRPFFASPNSVSGEAVGFKWRFICAANDASD